MNGKQFGILVVLLVVLGGAGLWLRNNQNSASGAGETGAGKYLLGEKFPINDVAKIEIKSGTNDLHLAKKDDVWRVQERDDYPANFAQISGFLLKAKDLKVIQVEEIGKSQLARMELAPQGQGTNSGTIVELKDKDGKALKTLILGKKHTRKPEANSPFGDEGFPDGRYVMAGADSHNALLIADPLDNLQPKPEEWLNKEFFKIERPKDVSVSFPEATNSWHLSRDEESGVWKLADAKASEKTDSTKVSGVTNPFSSPSFNDVLAKGAKPEEHGFGKATVVTVKTFDDFRYVVKVGEKTGEEYPVTMSVTADFPKERVPGKEEKPEDKDKADKAFKERQKQLEDRLKKEQAFENRIYMVPTWTVDQVIKVRKDLLEEKKEETKPAEGATSSDTPK